MAHGRGFGFRVIAAAIAVAGMAFMAPALAGAATFSQFNPAPDSAVGTNRPAISVFVTSTVPISSGNLTINGAVRGAQSLEYPIGHWESDEYDSWWVVDDNTQARITADFSNTGYAALPWGTIEVTATVNATSKYSWQFTTNPAPVISSILPTDGAYLTDLSPVISATVSDDGPVSGLMVVDGVVVTPSFDALSGVFSYAPPMPFADHTSHLVSFTAIDTYGITTRKDWRFRTDTHAPISFIARTPAANTTSTQAVNLIEVTADDEVFSIDAENPQNTLTVDGQPVTTSGMYPISYWDDDGYTSWFVVEDPTVVKLSAPVSITRDGTHTVTAHVVDTRGLVAEDTWTFAVGIPPVVSDMTPARGTPSQTPVIRAKMTDNDGVLPSVTMRVDGAVVPSVVDDATGYVSYTPSVPLSDNTSHTVTLDMLEDSGVTATKSWSFLVKSDAAVTFSGKSPTPGATLTNATVMASMVASSTYGLLPGTVQWFVDGASLYGWGSAQTTNRVSMYSQSRAYPDGAHTIGASIEDTQGVRSETQWSFTVQQKPSLGTPVPAAGSTVSVEFPMLGISVSDNTPGNVGLRLTMDGAAVFDGTVPQGSFVCTPTAGLVNGSTHSMVAVARDAAGNTQTTSWTFKVSAAPPMSDSDACTSCHTTYPGDHPMDNCTACHGYGEYHGIGSAPTPAGACLGCHDYYHGPGYITGMACTNCHSTAWPTVPRHEAAATEAKHVTSTTGCEGCHSTSLTVEHGKYPTASPFKYQCTLCHASTSAQVKAAVAAKSTACTSCHQSGLDHTSIHASTPQDPSCVKCHDANLIAEHVTKRKLSCRVCHGADFPIVGTNTGSTASSQLSGQVAASATASTANTKLSKTTPLSGTAAATVVDMASVNDAILTGDTSCDACHAAMPHGIRTDCTTCHGKIPMTTDGSEPTSTAPAQSTYVQWDGSGANASVSTPHKGYETTTVKCAVCHSVHDAATSGQVLLRSTVNAACEYCHISTSIGGIVLYSGDVNAYYAIHDDASHDRTSQSSCQNCHSVHGAKTMAGAKASKILWDWAASGRSVYATAALAVWPDPSSLANGDAQVTAFCTGCHAYYTQSYDETLTVQSFDHETTYDWTWSLAKSHVMTDTVGGQSDPAASLPVGTPTAWAASSYCRSCHDAGATDQGVGIHSDSFPHYTQGYFQFMTVSASYDASRAGNLTPDVDGLCLKCHRNGSEGVGLTY